MATKPSAAQPDPNRVYEAPNAYQQTGALKAAIELDVFTAIGEGGDSAAALANHCQATERGIRILCDYLTIFGFLTKEASRYSLTSDSATFSTAIRPHLKPPHRDSSCFPRRYPHSCTLPQRFAPGAPQ
jgi:hypothetical protein